MHTIFPWSKTAAIIKWCTATTIRRRPQIKGSN